MKLSIDLNDELIAKAQQLTGIKTKKAIVNRVLQVMIDLYQLNIETCLKLSNEDIKAGRLIEQDELDKLDREWLKTLL